MKTRKALLAFLLINLLSRMAIAQWEPTSGPVGGPALGSYRIGNRIIAVSNGPSTHQSDDWGQTWKQTASFYGSAANMELMWGKLYLTDGGSSSGSYIYSPDSGKTWLTTYVRTNSSTYLNASTKSLYRFGNLLFWAGQSYSTYTEDLVCYSKDSGQTWTSRSGLGNVLRQYNSQVNSFASIGSALFAASSSGVYYTADTGAIWSLRNGTGFINSSNITGIWAVGTRLFAINNYNNVFMSTDSAHSWQQVEQGITTSGARVSTIFSYKGMILGSATGNDTLYTFNTTLTKWESYSYDIKGKYGQSFFAYGDTLYMGGNEGLYYSLNNGQNWTLCAGKIRGVNLQASPVVIGNSILAADQKNLHRSDDNGDTWNVISTPYGPGGTGYLYGFFKTDNGLVYMSSYNDHRMSADTGKTWTSIPSTSMNYITAGAYSGGNYLFVAQQKLFSSADSGKTSTNIGNTIVSGLDNVTDIININGRLWMVSSRFGLYSSTDNGNTWTTGNNGLPSNYNSSYSRFDTTVSWIANIGSALICRARDAGTDQNYISFDNGQTWSFRSAAYMSKPCTLGNLIASGNYYSLDTLLTYSYGFSTGINPPYSNNLGTLVNSSSYMFAINGAQGVWRRPISTMIAPVTPTGGMAIALDQTRMRLSWNPVSNAGSYTVYYSTSATGTFNIAGTFYDTTFINNGLSAGITRYYYVVATNEFGKSVASSIFSGTTMSKPAYPINTSATGTSTTQIRLTWKTNNTTATKYFIETGAASCCAFTVLDSVDATDTFYIVSNLTKNTNYWFRIKCRDNGGYSDYTPSFAGATNDTLPKAPGNLHATALSQNSISLSWADSSDNETGFVIERKDAATSFTAIDSVTTNITHYTASGLTGATRYFFRVKAKNSGGYSTTYTNTDSADTYPVPVAPSGLIITSVTNNTAALSWADNSNSETGFLIERSTSGNTGPFYPYDSVSANITTRTVTGLSAATRYYFRVKTKDVYGYSAPSNVADTVTLPDAPFNPSNLTATTVSSSSISLTWTDYSYNEVYFDIEQSLNPVSGFQLIDSVPTNTTSYTVNHLNAATYYYYRVRARNAGGYSNYSNYAMGITNLTVPAAPTFLNEDDASHNWVKISWSDNSFNEERFVVQRATGTAGSFADFKTYEPGTTIAYDSSVTAGDVYKYRVYAQNVAGNSAFTNVVVVTVPLPLPAAPTNLTATAINHFTIDLSWTDAETDIIRYVIERKKGTGSFMPVDSVSGTTFSYSDDLLEATTSYTYRVRSLKNNSGYSDYSAEATASTLSMPAGSPLPPNSLYPTATEPTSVTLRWRDSSDNELKFYIERSAGNGFELIDSVNANTTTYTNSGLTENTLYTFRVRAWNAVGYSAYSNTLDVTTTIDLAAPQALYAEVLSVSSVRLNWTDLSAHETGFVIERSAAANGHFDRIDSVGANITTYTDAVPGKAIYYYRVLAKKGSHYSAASNVAVAIDVATGLDQVSGSGSLSVYPNPATDRLFIQSATAVQSVVIADNLGRIQETKMNDQVSGSYQLDLSGMQAGIYFVKVQLENGSVETLRFVKI